MHGTSAGMDHRDGMDAQRWHGSHAYGTGMLIISWHGSGMDHSGGDVITAALDHSGMIWTTGDS